MALGGLSKALSRVFWGGSWSLVFFLLASWYLSGLAFCSLGFSWALLVFLRGSLGLPGVLLDFSWTYLGTLSGSVGPPVGPLSGSPWALLAPSWASPGSSWQVIILQKADQRSTPKLIGVHMQIWRSPGGKNSIQARFMGGVRQNIDFSGAQGCSDPGRRQGHPRGRLAF